MIKRHWQKIRCVVVVVLTLVTIALARPIAAWRQAPGASATSSDWLLWGGPRRDFVTAGAGLASTWPSDGPTKLWSRPLGEGYSPIAIDARTGANLWEYAYESRFQAWDPNAVGPGPYAMPQVVGDRLVTASGAGKIHSIDKK